MLQELLLNIFILIFTKIVVVDLFQRKHFGKPDTCVTESLNFSQKTMSIKQGIV